MEDLTLYPPTKTAQNNRDDHTSTGKGVKYDTIKPRWDLLPLEATASTVDVLTHGAIKYAPDNWRKLEDLGDRYYGAALRHITAYRRGEMLDPESGHPHLAHAVCCLLFILEDELLP